MNETELARRLEHLQVTCEHLFELTKILDQRVTNLSEWVTLVSKKVEVANARHRRSGKGIAATKIPKQEKASERTEGT